MSLAFNDEGISIDELQDIVARLENGYRNIYGNDIVLDQDTPDGQRIGIESSLYHDMQLFAQWLYSQMDPDLNSGDMQQVIGKLSNTFLLPATQSQRDLVINMEYAATLPEGYTLTDQSNQQWYLDSDVNVVAGDNNVTFLSVLWGDITGYAGDTFTQSTPENGVLSITANVDAITGRNEETPEEFRTRRQRSTQNPSQGTVGSIYAKLAQLNGVTDIAVYDNGSNQFDTLTASTNQFLVDNNEPVSIEPHTIWAVVEGGSLDDIGEVLAKHNLGNSKGDLQVTYTETLTSPNGNEVTYTTYNQVDRPECIDLYVRLTATQTITGAAVDEAAIQNKLAATQFNIGQYIQAAELSDRAYIDNYNYILSDLEISLDGVTWTDERVFSGYNGKLSIDPANVTVNVVNI